MRRSVFIGVLACVALVILLLVPGAANAATTELFAWPALTDNLVDDTNPAISGSRVVWRGWDGGDWEIYYDDAADAAPPVPLTANTVEDKNPAIAGSRVVWSGWDGADHEIYYDDVADAAPPVPLTANTTGDDNPAISGSRVVWRGFGGGDWEIYYDDVADAAPPVALTANATEDYKPAISGGRVVWEQLDGDDLDHEVRLGTVVQRVTDNTAADAFPAVSGTRIVWSGHDGDDDEIYYDDVADLALPEVLGEDSTGDWFPDISGPHVVWQGFGGAGQGGDLEIFYDDVSDGDPARALAPDQWGDEVPAICGTRVIWASFDGSTDFDIVYEDAADAASHSVLEDDPEDDWSPAISGVRAVWAHGAGDGRAIFYDADVTDDAPPVSLAGSVGGDVPAISESRVVWQQDEGADAAIYYDDVADSVPAAAISGSVGGETPAISGSRVVWQASGGVGVPWEVYYDEVADPAPPVRLTKNTVTDEQPTISGSHIAWRHWDGADFEIYSMDLGLPEASPDGALPSQVAHVRAADGDAGDAFGTSVAVSGHTMVVGAPHDDVGGHVDQGSAAVYLRSAAGGWSLEATLTAADGAAGDRFGLSVGIEGDTIVVGSPFDDVGANADEGSARVFVRSGTEWSPQGTLLAKDAAAGDCLGVSVAVFGDTVVAGAPRDGITPNDWQGSAHVFTRSGGAWAHDQKLIAPGGAAYDIFGTSIAIWEDSLVVGALGDLGSSLEAGFTCVFARSAGTWAHQQTLIAPDYDPYDHFGASVAVNGGTVAIGAPGDDLVTGLGTREDQGSAYVFTRSGATWSHQQKLVADGAAGDAFGSSVGIDNDMATVGAPGDDVAGCEDRGSVHLFSRSGTKWTEEEQLAPLDGATDDEFGGSIAIWERTVVAGAAGDYVMPNADQGSAYVFAPYVTAEDTAVRIHAPGLLANDTVGSGEPLTAVKFSGPTHGDVTVKDDGSFAYTPDEDFNGLDTFTYRAYDGVAYSSPTLVTVEVKPAPDVPVAIADGALPALISRLLSSDGKARDSFGSSVALSGDTAVVGAPHVTVGANTSQGAAYVFTRSGTTWTEQAKLTGFDGVAANDNFGVAVAISGDTIVVGADRSDVSGRNDQGAAYVFTRDGTTWTQQARLTATDGKGADCLGYSVDISGDAVVAGAWSADVGTNANQGAAYVFTRSGTTWTQQARLTASDGRAYDWLAAVAIEGDTVVAGAYRADVGSSVDQGAAWVFVREGAAWAEQAKLTSSDGAADDWFGTSVDVSGDTVVIGATEAHVDTPADQGAAYVFTREGSAWTQRQRLAASDADAEDGFGVATALSGSTLVIGASGDDLGKGAYQGSAYVFAQSGSTWTEKEKVAAFDGEAGDHFGAAIGLSGDTIVVGAFDDTVGSSSWQGSACVFAPYRTPRDTALTIANPGVLWNDRDADGDALTAELMTPPANASVMALDPDGSFTYSPTPGFSGIDTFTYRAWDGSAFSEPALVTIEVVRPNTAPVANPDGGQFEQVAHLLGPLGTATEFTSSIAVSGDTMVLGCSDENVGGSGYQGAAHVLVRSGTTWTEQTTLIAADGAESDWFGTSVAISGETIVVGAPGADVGGNANQGSVHVFVRSGGVWRPQQTLTPADGEAGDTFGQAVAIAGETLVATAPHDSVGANAYQGSARVFVRAGGVWSPEATLKDESGEANDFFGTSAAIWGDTVIVGDAAETVRGNRAQGSASIFVRSAGAWSTEAYLALADGAANDWFGCSVSVMGDTAVVGAQGRNATAGAAYVFTRGGVVWSPQATLAADDGQPSDYFGRSVGVWGDTAIVGTMTDDVGANVDQGSVRIFVHADGLWLPQPMLTGAGTAANDFFGASVGISEQALAVGAYHWDRGANTGQHSAFVFSRGYVTPENTPLRIDAPGLLANDTDAENDALSASKVSDPAHGTVVVGADGSFTYTPSAGFTGSDSFTYRAYDGQAYSAPALVIIRVMPGTGPAATTLSLKGPASAPAYNTATTLRATLATASGPTGAGHTIIFQRYTGGKWVTLGSATTDAAGVARHSTRALTTATRFRARFSGDTACAASNSPELLVAPKAWLTTPSAPTTAYRNKAFTTTGYLKPRHSAGTFPVRLQCFRYQKQAGAYKWVLRKTVSAKAANYSTYTRYSAKVALAYGGKWRIRARHLDASHALTYSGWRYLTVK